MLRLMLRLLLTQLNGARRRLTAKQSPPTLRGPGYTRPSRFLALLVARPCASASSPQSDTGQTDRASAAICGPGRATTLFEHSVDVAMLTPTRGGYEKRATHWRRAGRRLDGYADAFACRRVEVQNHWLHRRHLHHHGARHQFRRRSIRPDRHLA